MKVHGDLEKLRQSVIADLELLYNMEIPYGQIVTNEIISIMGDFTGRYNRELAIYISRRGRVLSVAVGNLHTVELPAVEGRRAINRLSGVRCVHTHPSSNSQLSSADFSSLRELRLDIMVAVGTEGYEATEASIGYISGFTDNNYELDTIGPITIQELLEIDITTAVKQIEHSIADKGSTEHNIIVETALLVGLDNQRDWPAQESLNELAQLAETAGAEVKDFLVQKREKPDSTYYIGKGKVEEIKLICQNKHINVLICDDELSPAQQRNLEQSLGIKILDRTALILDIFAQRARSREGKMQVELAQLRYNLPRLSGKGLILSRLGGGIGTRGPGETKLEVDRRRIRTRISEIESQIEQIKKQRDLHRVRRQTTQIPTVALVGYTNAGKSTLLNLLTNSAVLAEDKLFATLDPTTRRLELPSGREVLITDTVGFIHKLPHQLIAAFRATLEEVVQADVLLHVIDVSNIQFKQHSEAVFKVLRELKADYKTIITVYNKVDRLDNNFSIDNLLQREQEAVGISALSGAGIDRLLSLMEEHLAPDLTALKILLPYENSGLTAKIYDVAQIQNTLYTPDGIYFELLLPAPYVSAFEQYTVGDDEIARFS